MGNRPSAADDSPTSPKSPRVAPAEFARRELAKPRAVDDDALYNDARNNSVGIYYRLKIELILDVARIVSILPEGMRSTSDEQSIKERIQDALKEYKIKASTTWEFQDTKRALRVSKEQTNQKLEAMEAKINNITDMLQKLLEKEQS